MKKYIQKADAHRELSERATKVLDAHVFMPTSDQTVLKISGSREAAIRWFDGKDFEDDDRFHLFLSYGYGMSGSDCYIGRLKIFILDKNLIFNRWFSAYSVLNDPFVVMWFSKVVPRMAWGHKESQSPITVVVSYYKRDHFVSR